MTLEKNLKHFMAIIIIMFIMFITSNKKYAKKGPRAVNKHHEINLKRIVRLRSLKGYFYNMGTHLKF